MLDGHDFSALLQAFFTTRLMAQRKASPHTIASYGDTFRLPAATALVVGIYALQPCGRSFVTPHWKHRHMPARFNVCWRFPTSDNPGRWCIF